MNPWPSRDLLSLTLIAHTRLSDDGRCFCGYQGRLGDRFTDHQADALIAAVADLEGGAGGRE